ncbi:MAG: hypothetical protein R3332_07265 [Pseudohongiellaceae bacterium]|nr:hypothetical protein [Pseudohongiellaceae bacterium]
MRQSKRICNPIFVEEEPYNWSTPGRTGPKMGYIVSIFLCAVAALYLFAQ